MTAEYLPATYVAERRRLRIATLQASIAYLNQHEREARGACTPASRKQFLAKVRSHLAKAYTELDRLLVKESSS